MSKREFGGEDYRIPVLSTGTRPAATFTSYEPDRARCAVGHDWSEKEDLLICSRCQSVRYAKSDRLQAFIRAVGDIGLWDDLQRARKNGDTELEQELMRFEAEIRRRELWLHAKELVKKCYARAKSKKTRPHDELMRAMPDQL